MNDSRIHLRLPADLVGWLREYAQIHGVTISQVIRALVLELARAEAERQQALEAEAKQI